MKNNWRIVTLGEILKFVRGPFGGSLKKSIFKENGYAVYEQQHAIYDQFNSIRYFIDEKKFSEMKRFELKSGDLIMSCSGTMGKIAIVPKNIKKGIINQALLKLTPSEKVLNTFIRYWIQSDGFQESLKEYSQGAAIKNVASVKILKKIKISLPPVLEQKRIVRIIDESFENIEIAKKNTENNLNNSKKLFESNLDKIFKQVKLVYKSKKIGDIFKTGAGGTPLKSHSDYYKNGTIPWLRSGEVCKKEIIKPMLFITEKGLKNSSAKMFVPETVLVAMYGATAGQVGILKFKSTTNQAVCGIYPCKDIIPEFIYYFFLNEKDNLIKQAVGGAQPNISQIKIKNTKIPIIPVFEQQQLVKKLDKLSSQTKQLEQLYTKKLKNLEELKKSILQKAFNGEL